MMTSKEKLKAPKLCGTNIFCGEQNFKHQDGVHCDRQMPDGSWKPSRPLGYDSMLHRIKCAYLVLKGTADIMVWLNP
jgi:hypothetical protein